MVGLLEIFEMIKAIFQFPSVILEFVRLLKKTPQENHEGIVKAIQAEAQKFDDSGRPTW